VPLRLRLQGAVISTDLAWLALWHKQAPVPFRRTGMNWHAMVFCGSTSTCSSTSGTLTRKPSRPWHRGVRQGKKWMPHRVGRDAIPLSAPGLAAVGHVWMLVTCSFHPIFASWAMHSGRQFARRVSLHDCAAVTDSALEPLALHCPRLGTVAPLACGAARANIPYNKRINPTEVLNVSGCRQFTAAACWVCRGGVYNMQALSRCQNISGHA
jgi:hypothetical protein